ncbi:unnamed protein product [marine sediment metagenome]|uniref:Uncharacterized protein n=1 Tax=marine sediment metagenome TaxID=412755 RepID=X1E081_9ZZZZ
MLNGATLNGNANGLYTRLLFFEGFMSKNTERTLKYLRNEGYIAEVVERFIAFPPPHGHRKDFLGIIDIIAFNEVVTLGVQSCGQAFAAHLKKMNESEMTPRWLESVDRELWLIGWRKLKVKRGGKLKVWKPRIQIFERENA